MIKEYTDTGSLRPQEFEVVYAISKVVAEEIEINAALEKITELARPVFIFDSVALYLYDEKSEALEPAFARAIGRGRSMAADLVWGDMAATEAFQSGKNYIFQAEISQKTDRLDQYFYLGLPMIAGGKILGALVFIRFGGPVYTEDQINLAEFMVVHVTQLIERQRLVKKVANLEAERRLAELQEEFIAAVSHELNTPLGFIKGYTTTLLREDTRWDEQTWREFLVIIDEETDRLSELIDNLLDSSLLQSGAMSMDFRELDLNPLITDLVEKSRRYYDNLKFKSRLDSKQIKLKADPKRLTQVLNNLFNNAAKYAPGSTVTVSGSEHEGVVQLSIADDGPGISGEHLEHLFKRFYRVPERSAGMRGSGLGLFICERIVHAHGGQIIADSKVGEGTTFHIFLPVKESPKAKLKEKRHDPADTRSR